MLMSVLLVFSLAPMMTLAQTNDQVVADVLGTSRWYLPTDKDMVKVVSTTATTATIQAPLVKKDGQSITWYYITWAPISYKDITASSNKDDLDKVKDSDAAALATGKPIYTISGSDVIITLEISDPTKDVYVTILPEAPDRTQGTAIEDFKFNITTASTAVAWDVYDTKSNQAIANVTCVWDATENRTTLLWDVNTAMNATKVEIGHRPDENPWEMAIKGTPAITLKRFVVDTPHRNIQVFRLKPLDANGTMLGVEIMYVCKPANWSSVVTPITPTDPTKPIPVIPHTGPVETTAILFFLSLLGYFIYKKIKA